ncbi:MAG: glucosaminidase domain-containing protein [Olsenella sp.]|nr:glucosaminidase domain-containing protein [Olsenella sp.]
MKLTQRMLGALVSVLALACVLPAGPALAEDAEAPMYRLYNSYTGEHFYTGDSSELSFLVREGWRYEGVGWNAPASSETPVFRLYNPFAGDHHYTTSAGERDHLESVGWRYEGVGWYSDDEERVPLYRQYNPNAQVGTHNYTASRQEDDFLVSEGWMAEGVAWYACSEGATASAANDAPIMAPTFSSVGSMVACYHASGHDYPADVLGRYGASSIEEFCQILVEEAQSEGVSGDVVFAQAMHETGYLSFTGAVTPDMCNFAGLGANSSVPGSGNRFGSVREGLLAQVQHLKAYASTEPLNNPCVDQRFGYVKRGCAPFVSELSGRWAGADYGGKVLALLNNLYRY